MRSILQVSTLGSGSTYFQRAATFWIRELIDPTITNPHDILNGIRVNYKGHLIKDFTSSTFQTIDDIIKLLTDNRYPVLIRISYEHLKNFKLSHKEEINLCKFLSNNFDVYVSRRDDLFDYGMCWAVRKQTDIIPNKQINNVHTIDDRIRFYQQINYTVDTNIVIEQAEKYLEYVSWSKQRFPYSIPVFYDETERNIDDVLAKLLPANQSIEQKYGISIHDYSRYLYLLTKNAARGFKKTQLSGAKTISDIFDDMVALNIMPDTLPIKSTTICDKMEIITNFNDCLSIYNKWAQLGQRPQISLDQLEIKYKRQNSIYNVSSEIVSDPIPCNSTYG